MLAVALTACGASSGSGDAKAPSGPPADVSKSDWEAVVKKANEEGAVTVYVSLTGTEPLFKDFEKAYPDIKVKIENTPTADLVARLDQEMAAGVAGADVVMHAQPLWFPTQQKAGRLATLQLGPDAQDAGWKERLGKDNYAKIYGFPYTIAYRTDKPKPTNIKAILDADPKARIGLVDPKVAPAIANIYEQLRKDYGDGILDKLAASNYVIEASSIPLASNLAAGTFDYGVGNIATISRPLAAKGAPISEAVPTESIAGSFYDLAIPKTAPHSNAAQVLSNWLMSRSGQQSFAKNASPAALPVDVEGALSFDKVSMFDPEDWTQDKWDAWIAKYWTPRFG